MVDKLSKALDGLKNIQFTTAIEDTALRKKEKMMTCVFVADLMVSLKHTTAQNLPQLISIMMESYLHLCDDKDSDVRMVADESLNRIIRALTETSMLKVQIELHNEIRKNGPARCLRAALWRFGQLSHYIRPNKGRKHVQNLIPCLLVIAKREEESIHETLSLSLPNIFKVLGVFTHDNDVKSLLKVFLHNLSSSNAVIRRTSASSIITIVQYCRKPHVFNSFVLNTLLDCVIPICEDNSSYLILGILCCLRLLLPYLTCDRNDEGLGGSFGLRRKQDESLLSVDRLIQTYELCLHYSKSKDHNVVTAALETLNQLLQNPPQQLESLLLSPAGFSKSYVYTLRENKLWMRSSSEMSVACSLTGGDESLFLDDIEATSPFTSIMTTEHSDIKQSSSSKEKARFPFSDEDTKVISNPFSDKLLNDNLEDQLTPDIDSDTESIAASETNAPSNFLMRVQPEEKESAEAETRECSRSNSRDDLYTVGDAEANSAEGLDVGAFTDAAVPLIYCARHLTASYLLDGTPDSLKTDRSVRVSVKSLVLSCLSSIVKLYPSALRMELTRSQTENCSQDMSDVLLYSDHSDPQIRGGVNALIGSFINAALIESKGFESAWLTDENSKLRLDYLMDIILKGLKDKSSICSRQALHGLKLCLNTILQSVHYPQILPVLQYLPVMASNSYWLVKAKLVEVLSDLPFVCISDIVGSNSFQNEVIDSVILTLLGDEDSRVRTAAAETLVKLIPQLYYGKSTVLDYSTTFTDLISKHLKLKKESVYNNVHLNLSPPFWNFFKAEHETDYKTEDSLSRIVTKLTYSLLVAVNKHLVYGIIEALKLLSLQYPTTVYLRGWNCWNQKTAESEVITSSLLNIVLSLLITSPVILDLTAYSNATVLLGNLFAGHCICNLKNDYQVAVQSPTGGPLRYWNVFKSEQLSQIAEQILIHVLKMLNIYSHLLEEVPLSKVSSSSSTATALLPISLPSPIKKQDKKSDKDDKPEDRKPKNYHNYRHTPQYFKLYKSLKNAYTNYKISLESSVSDKFLDLLESTINTLSILLEIGTVHDTGRCAEEILSYLRPAVSLRANPSVVCVIQLLKSLFGINLAATWEEVKTPDAEIVNYTLFGNLYQLPSDFLLERIRSHASSSTCEGLTGVRRRPDRKVVIKNTDKNCLATYIRLFEPMVVKSLKLYTISNDVELQSHVLRLLNQLVQLRVNYCLLDADEAFVGFVLKQFELIEQGQIPGVEVLLPEVFKFLVLLSYEKHHSKNIMSVPKILQLCDGLMASDQSTQTHCIPALIPIVEDVFLSRSLVSSTEQKELETQREVLLAMLLRLAEFHQVMDTLTLILKETRTLEERDRWKRWSKQVMDTILPLAAQGRLRTETVEGQDALSRLMTSLSPNVMRPIDPLLRVLFFEPQDYNCRTSLKRWLSCVTVLLEIILHVKEDVLLIRLQEVAPNLNLNTFLPPGKLYSPDPFNVTSTFQSFESAETIARFLFKVISVAAFKILESVSSSSHLQHQLSVFFVCVFHMLGSGTFHRTTNALQILLSKEEEEIAKTSSMFINLSNVSPQLTCQYAYFLALLNHCDRSFWDSVLRKSRNLSTKLVQYSGVISLADYLCENLSDVDTLKYLLLQNIPEVVILSNEAPVRELISSIHRRKAECNLLIQAVSSKCPENSDARFVEKLLRILEIADNSHSGALVFLLVKKFLISSQLSLSRLASSLACRRVECLLTLTPDKVLEQLDRDMFTSLMDFIADHKLTRWHGALVGLLNKLSTQVYDLSPLDYSQNRAVNPQYLKNIQLDEEWYFAQVKHRCCQENYPGTEMANLLSKLSHDRILEIMSCKDFNVRILKDCLMFREAYRRADILHSSQDESGATSNDALFQASKECLLELINGAKKVISRKSNHRLKELSDDKYFCSMTWKMAPSLTVLLKAIHSESSEVDKEFTDGIMKFGVFCIEMLNWLTDNEEHRVNQNMIESALRCCSAVLHNAQVKQSISNESNCSWLKSCIDNTFTLVTRLVPQFRFQKDDQERSIEDSDVVKLELLLKLVMSKSGDALLPNCLTSCVSELIINLCRVPELSFKVLKVPESGEMQELELLEEFIARFSVLGWSNRQQFEEIWVGLLAVVGFNTQGNTPPEETAFIVQASTAAVEGITTLLKNAMLDPTERRLIHHGRDWSSMSSNVEKFPVLFDDHRHHLQGNLELSTVTDRYHPGLLSVEYIWTAVKQINNPVDLYEKHSKDLSVIGLDLTSCVHLLIELYTQWIYQTTPDVRIVTASLRSAIVISDLFTDIAQFQWLLDFCLYIDTIAISEDLTLLPLVILGCSKAVAVVVPDLEMCEKLKRLMLRSSSIPCRIATVQGLLYLLQSPVLCLTVNKHGEKPTFQMDETNFVTNIVDMFFPLALDLVQRFKLYGGLLNAEYEQCCWSLLFYLLQHYPTSLGDAKEEMFTFVLTTLRSKASSDAVTSLLVRGVERLLFVCEEKFIDQITKISLEMISHSSTIVYRNGLQLLMALSFLEKKTIETKSSADGQDDPEKIMRGMEKVNVLFEKLKRSYPNEAEVVGEVISYILMDFTASDILTKVIQEFLSTHQPHLKILSGLLFKVFQRAELSLLEDWVVFSLPSFTQGIPLTMSIWTLNCFFVCASGEPWLRSLFPLVRSRLRMAEVDDRKLLCLSASHFYSQLKDEKQKKLFVNTFENAAKIHSVFQDLLSALR